MPTMVPPEVDVTDREYEPLRALAELWEIVVPVQVPMPVSNEESTAVSMFVTVVAAFTAVTTPHQSCPTTPWGPMLVLSALARSRVLTGGRRAVE